MRPVKPRDLQRTMPTVTAEEFTIFCRRTLRRSAGDAALSLPDQLRLLVWEWIRHLGFVTDGQTADLLRSERIDTLARWIASHWAQGHGQFDRRALITFQLTLADHRYARWTGEPDWHDFVYGEPVAVLPAPPVTLILCDLTALYCRALDRLERLREPIDAQPAG